MNRSYSKIRHIQEANLKLETRLEFSGYTMVKEDDLKQNADNEYIITRTWKKK
jgi:hypothetical protein